MSSLQSATIKQTVKQKTQSATLCRVCNERSDGAHFGIDSCRACAAFFRRSITLKKTYACRRGGDNCDIRRKDIATCRKCRLRRCKEVGMAIENIQSQKGSFNGTPDDPQQGRKDGTPDSDMMKRYTQTFPDDSPYDSSLSFATPSLTPLDSPSRGYLQTMISFYRQLCVDRRASEYSLGLQFSMEARKKAVGDFLPCNNTKASQIFGSHISPITNFVSQCFPDIYRLEEEDKWLIFKSFVFIIWNLECIYRTYKRMPKCNTFTKMALSETTYVDTEKLDEFVSEVEEKTRNSLANHLKGYFRNAPHLLRMTTDLQLDEEEYMVVLGCCFWNPTLFISAPGENIARECRKRFFNSLEQHLISKGETNFAERLGNIFSFISNIMMDAVSIGEALELVNLLDGFVNDSSIYDMLRR